MENTIQTTPEILQVDAINGLALTTKQAITEAFMPFAVQFAEWKEKALQIEVNEPTQVELMKQASEARKAIKNIRNRANDVKDELKAESLKYNSAVQEVRNKIWVACEAIEARLEKQEKFKELYDARVLAERTAQRMDRLKEFPDVSSAMISGLTDDMFEITLTGLITKRDKDIEDERIAEEARQAEIKAEEARKEAQRIEFERLKAENEAKELELAKQREEAEKERIKQQAILEAERKKADELLETQRKQAAAAKAKQDEILAKQKAENDRLIREAKEKEQAEALRLKEIEDKKIAEEKERIAAEKKAAKAPDKSKLKLAIDGIYLPEPELKEQESKAVYSVITARFEGFKTWALSQIETL